MPKVFIIACEPSGDSHGAHLIEEIKSLAPGTEFKGLGGPQMQKAGVSLLYDMTTISALGLGDVIRQYPLYHKIFHNALAELRRFRPDVVVLIDSPAFNLRFAKKIKKEFPVVYYISPQIWAWGGRRIHTIKRTVTKMLTILPFENEVYKKVDLDCEFVGHPLLDSLKPGDRTKLRTEFEIRPETKAIGLLPGSRAKEVVRILPAMLETAKILHSRMPETAFFLTHSPNVPEELYKTLAAPYADLPLRHVRGKMQDLVTAMDFCLVASGTATLETALLGTPFFLLYKASFTTYILGKYLIRVPFLGLVNLLAAKKDAEHPEAWNAEHGVVPEFIQGAMDPKTMAHEAEVFLKNPQIQEKMKEDFKQVRILLGERGASRKAAQAVLKFLSAGRV